jgi:hypothetical protein
MNRKKIPENIKERIRQQAKNRCGYCLSRQDLVPNIFQIDHILALALGGTDDEENFWLLCPKCNLAKSKKTEGFDEKTQSVASLFNPRTQNWQEHFEWSPDGTQIIGKTAIGRVTVIEAKLNDNLHITVRLNWIKAGWHPPKD